ncbi:MAG: tetratricopeptide repeat protein, partial [Candidatus Sumerlaeota bacterium]
RLEDRSRMVLERWPDLADRPRRRRTVVTHSPSELSEKLIGNLAVELVYGKKAKMAKPLIDALGKSSRPEAHLTLIDAVRTFREGAPQEALDKALCAIQAGLDSAAAWNMAGLAAYRASGPREALPCFLEAAKRRPRSPGFWCSAAEAFIEVEDWPRAKAAIMQALEADLAHSAAELLWRTFAENIDPVEPNFDLEAHWPDAPTS